MAEFVNIEGNDDSLNIPNTPRALPDVELESGNFVYPIEEKEQVERVAPESILNDCEVSRFYGDPHRDDSFKKSNLFSELVDEYQRSVARKNLGISDKYSLTWGFITGNILQQTDLYNFITNLTNAINADIRADITSILSLWEDNITNLLESRASLDSPNFTGQPTSVSPSIDDNSNRIATTEWVNSKLLSLGGSNNLTYMSLSKTFMYIDETNVSTTCTWEYDSAITFQSINGISLSTNVREYTFSNINNSFSINLTYTIGNSTYSKILNFEKITPKYYGKSSDVSQCIKTKDNYFTVICSENEYAYVYVPNGSEARIAVDNMVGGFIFTTTILVSNVIYYVYRSVNKNLGKLYITIL